MSEKLMACAFLQQSAEHFVSGGNERWLFVVRFVLASLLLFGFYPAAIEGALLAIGIIILYRFQGPYNGGSDRLSLLLLVCLLIARSTDAMPWRESVLEYFALQLVLSYVAAGWVKSVNPAWRNGQALTDVFAFSVYPVSEQVRTLANFPRFMLALSRLIMGFEILFPLSLLNLTSLYVVLAMATFFHLVNACVFGLNRFLWIWIAGYPCLIWFQQRVFG